MSKISTDGLLGDPEKSIAVSASPIPPSILDGNEADNDISSGSDDSKKRTFLAANMDPSSSSLSSPTHSPQQSRRPSNTSVEDETSRSRPVMEVTGNSGLWVFGYGSLCWLQGFEYSESMTGFVVGFSRRFWQGNVTHRGTQHKPGRVATLVDDSEGVVWGEAFRVTGEAALPYLNNRECELGGYRTTLASFHPRDHDMPPFPALLYIATPNNCHWLGEETLPLIADQIVDCEGASGHNVEYLLRLADFIRERVPDVRDDHLFELEALVRVRVVERRLCLKTLMGETPISKAVHVDAAVPEPQPVAASSFQFSNRVPSKKLRCVNI